MESPVKHAGWTGTAGSSKEIPRVGETKRSGRNIDVMGM